jgi:hypothetical protein
VIQPLAFFIKSIVGTSAEYELTEVRFMPTPERAEMAAFTTLGPDVPVLVEAATTVAADDASSPDVPGGAVGTIGMLEEINPAAPLAKPMLVSDVFVDVTADWVGDDGPLLVDELPTTVLAGASELAADSPEVLPESLEPPPQPATKMPVAMAIMLMPRP